MSDVDTDYDTSLRDTGDADIANGFCCYVPKRMNRAVRVCDRYMSERVGGGPREIACLDELSKTVTGKLRRVELRVLDNVS